MSGPLGGFSLMGGEGATDLKPSGGAVGRAEAVLNGIGAVERVDTAVGRVLGAAA